MAKTLDKAPPSSSAARLLDLGAVARATMASSNQSHDSLPSPGTADSTRSFIKREFILDEDADTAFVELMRAFRDGTGTRLSASQALRALLWAVLPAVNSLRGQLSNSGPWKLPGNGIEAEAARIAFHHRLAQAMQAALVKTLGR